MQIALIILAIAGLILLYWLTQAGWFIGLLIGLFIVAYAQWRQKRKP
jgi:hypothetical protein